MRMAGSMDRVRDSRQHDLKGLKALVIGLGVLIVVGTALVIGVVIKRVVESTTRPAPSAATQPLAVPSVAPFAATLPGGAGAKIGGVAAAGGTVAIWLRDGKGGRIVFIDPHDGKILGTAASSP